MLVAESSPTVAHDGQPFILLRPDRAAAGERISADLDLVGPTQTYRITLVGDGVALDVGMATTDAVGHAWMRFDIPADLRPGVYAVQAVGPAGPVASTNVMVSERVSGEDGLIVGAALGLVALAIIAIVGAAARRRQRTARADDPASPVAGR